MKFPWHFQSQPGSLSCPAASCALRRARPGLPRSLRSAAAHAARPLPGEWWPRPGVGCSWSICILKQLSILIKLSFQDIPGKHMETRCLRLTRSLLAQNLVIIMWRTEIANIGMLALAWQWLGYPQVAIFFKGKPNKKVMTVTSEIDQNAASRSRMPKLLWQSHTGGKLFHCFMKSNSEMCKVSWSHKRAVAWGNSVSKYDFNWQLTIDFIIHHNFQAASAITTKT